jgi:hypothetical protein
VRRCRDGGGGGAACCRALSPRSAHAAPCKRHALASATAQLCSPPRPHAHAHPLLPLPRHTRTTAPPLTLGASLSQPQANPGGGGAVGVGRGAHRAQAGGQQLALHRRQLAQGKVFMGREAVRPTDKALSGRWILRLRGRRVAARAYDCAAVQARGPGAERNFPGEAVRELPVTVGEERKQRSSSSRYIGVSWHKATSSWEVTLWDPRPLDSPPFPELQAIPGGAACE